MQWGEAPFLKLPVGRGVARDRGLLLCCQLLRFNRIPFTSSGFSVRSGMASERHCIPEIRRTNF